MSDRKSVFQKWLEVMRAVGYIQKSGSNDYHKYTYVTESDLLEAVRPAMIEQGLIAFPSKATVVDVGKSVITIHYIYRVVDTETGDSFETEVVGQGADSADKGAYKASTGANKYFLMKAFMLATGDDPEEDKDSLNVLNPNATTVIRALQDIGYDFKSPELEDAVGTPLQKIKNDKKGSHALRLTYSFASAYDKNPDEEEKLLARLKEAIANGETKL